MELLRWRITAAPRELARVRGHQWTRWVGRDHYDRHLSPVQLSGKRLSVPARAICDTSEAPTLITGPR